MTGNEQTAAAEGSHPGRRRTVFGQLMGIASVGASLLAIFGLMAAGSAALHLRAAADPPKEVAPPVRVAVTRVQIEPGYRRTASHTGRLEAARQSALAFERGGLVVAVVRDEGDRVRAGETVARLDVAQLEAGRRQLEARRRELAAQRALAEATLGRQSRLKTQGWSPEQRFDETEASVAQLAAALEQVDAQIAGVDIDLAKSDLQAPFDGEVAGRMIDEGTVVAAGTHVLTIVESGRRQARIGLPPDVATRLDPQTRYLLRAGSRTLEARLAARRPDLETGTRTVTALFDITSPDAGLALGDLVSLELDTLIPERGAWIALSALKEGQRGLWTVLVASGATPESAVIRPEAVEVLHAAGDRVFVRGTIRDGDHVLSTGTDRVVAGQRVALARE